MAWQAYAATYYVATNGNNSNSGSSGSPWLTMQKAFDTVNPGDIVLILGGTYSSGTILLTRSGSSGSMITFKPDPGTGTPILRHNGSAQYGGGFLTIRNAHHIRIEGLRISDFTHGYAMIVEATDRDHSPQQAYNIEIVGNTFTNLGTREAGTYAWVDSGLILSYSGPDILVDNNTFSNIYGYSLRCFGCFNNTLQNNTITGMKPKLVTWSDSLFAAGIWTGGEDKNHASPSSTQGQYNLIKGNLIKNNATDSSTFNVMGIWCDVGGHHHTIEENVVHNVNEYGIHIEARCNDNIIRKNVVYSVGNSGFKTASMSTSGSARNTWDHNVAYNNTWAGFAFHNSSGNVVTNNIGMNNGTSQIHVAAETVSGGGNSFHHNLWYKSTTSNVARWNSGNYWDSANLALSAWNSSSGATNELGTNPLFTDPAAGNFILQTGSPAKGSGSSGTDRGIAAINEKITTVVEGCP